MTQKIPSFIQEYETKQADLTAQNTDLDKQIKELTVLHDKNKLQEEDMSK